MCSSISRASWSIILFEPATIPEAYQDLFAKVAFAHLATLMPDGKPQVTPVWVEYDGTHVRVNSAKGRLKDRNMRRDKRVALSIQDTDNAYRYIAVRGELVEITDRAGRGCAYRRSCQKIPGQGSLSFSRPGRGESNL
jgi:PPOX class probable F420-dependent enzyme